MELVRESKKESTTGRTLLCLGLAPSRRRTGSTLRARNQLTACEPWPLRLVGNDICGTRGKYIPTGFRVALVRYDQGMFKK
jgi:hypothetical protein